ncbi:MAG: hypothetical protein Ct9H300mP19_06030 [Dehalococcoidia bacterium]|nr:MAG: hypothetical protein Ct9H300mP19_06030 [Dehalococcoidia bacterium]
MHHVEPVGEKNSGSLRRKANRQRFARMFEKFQPFPFDRHDGHGFDRLPDVDIEAVKPHDGPTVGTIHTLPTTAMELVRTEGHSAQRINGIPEKKVRVRIRRHTNTETKFKTTRSY